MDFINQNIMLISLVVASGGALLWQMFGGEGRTRSIRARPRC